MKLYYLPGASSLAVHIAMREAGLVVELKKVDLATKQIEGGGDYLKVNPKGYIPALQLDDGSVLTEAPVILQYVADQRPESGLAPKAGTLARYRLQEWLNFISAELHKCYGPLFTPTAAPEWKAGVMTTLKGRLDWVNKELAAKSYLMGEQFTVADPYLFSLLGAAAFVGVDFASWPALTAYRDRIGQRPKVQEAMKAEGLIK